MTESLPLNIRAVGTDLAEANRIAGDLEDWLAQETPAINMARIRDNVLDQDFGATLAVILGTTAVTALAKGIANWLARRQDTILTLSRTSPTGEVIIVELDGQMTSKTEQTIARFLT